MRYGATALNSCAAPTRYQRLDHLRQLGVLQVSAAVQVHRLGNGPTVHAVDRRDVAVQIKFDEKSSISEQILYCSQSFALYAQGLGHQPRLRAMGQLHAARHMLYIPAPP